MNFVEENKQIVAPKTDMWASDSKIIVNYPSGMALFFLVWVLVLPFVIPWTEWTR
jgi:hypothetical protein